MACTREVVGLHASPAEVSREPGVSWPARGSSLGPAMHVDSQVCGQIVLLPHVGLFL